MSYAHYILQVNIYLVVFYGFYKLLLDNETYFILNRAYLVGAGLLSLAIPFLRFEWFTTQPAAQQVYVSVDQLMTQVTVIQEAPGKFSTGNLIVLLYLAGVLFFIFRFIFQLFSVRALIKKADIGSAFSFFNKKIIDEELPQAQTIHKHEEIHIRQLHTLDVLFFEVLGIITWFNPIIYFYKHAVKNIHEYLADEAAANFQGDKEEYALLLLSSAFGVTPNSFTNSFFNKSLIKKRIFMLHKQRSRKTAILKYGLFVPLFAIMLIMSSATIRDNEKILQVAEEIPLEQPLVLAKDAVKEVIATPVTTVGQIEIAVSSGKTGDNWKDFYTFLQKSIRYPSAAKEAKLQGNSVIKFTLRNNEINGLGVASKPLGSGLDAQVMRNILAYKGFKNTADGDYLLTVSFRLSGVTTAIQNEEPVTLNGYTALNKVVVLGYETLARQQNSGEDNIYDFVTLDSQPVFPGGMDKFYAYIIKNIKYPQAALKDKVEGKVFLSFIVEKDGALKDIKVVRRLGSGTDEEAVRIIEGSPKWVPGKKNGEIVRVRYNIPIAFYLSKTGKGATDKKATTIIKKTTGASFSDENGNIMVMGDQYSDAPLYIVDGSRVEKNWLTSAKPEDIESISVLKSASATTLYGTEGKNGVVLVTTKAGKFIKPSRSEGTINVKGYKN